MSKKTMKKFIKHLSIVSQIITDAVEQGEKLDLEYMLESLKDEIQFISDKILITKIVEEVKNDR